MEFNRLFSLLQFTIVRVSWSTKDPDPDPDYSDEWKYVSIALRVIIITTNDKLWNDMQDSIFIGRGRAWA